MFADLHTVKKCRVMLSGIIEHSSMKANGKDSSSKVIQIRIKVALTVV